ncbi:hypothetical protein [Anaerotignum neopropionicum]|uniref:hypothetical protein n=1 Tax=Anaerotignum neopropionicum TaxID=36847 RepID=UPI0012FDE293|nr:hypothetical protein [Anaerotignum neopropionicum]
MGIRLLPGIIVSGSSCITLLHIVDSTLPVRHRPPVMASAFEIPYADVAEEIGYTLCYNKLGSKKCKEPSHYSKGRFFVIRGSNETTLEEMPFSCQLN